MIHSRLAHRTLALSLLLFVLFGFVSAGYSFVSYHQARNKQILEHRQTLGRLQALVEKSHEIDRLAAAGQAQQASRIVFHATTTPLLIAQLQQQLQAIVTSNQAQFVRASELPTRHEDELTFAGLRLEVTGTVQSLSKILSTIEASVPILIVEKATIAADPMAQSAPDRIPQLAMSLAITVVSQTGASDATTAKTSE